MKKELLDKGWKIYMSNTQSRNTRQRNNQRNQVPSAASVNEIKNGWKEFFSHPLVTTIITAVITALIVATINIAILKNETDHINTSINNINTNITSIQNQIGGENGIYVKLATMQSGIDAMKENSGKALYAFPEFFNH